MSEISEAEEILKRVPSGKRVIAWSGGKDSTVLLHFALSRGLVDEVFTIDFELIFPELRQFIRDVADEWGVDLTVIRPSKTFEEIASRRGFPRRRYPWCRKYLKIDPLYDYLLSKYDRPVYVVAGVRRAESPFRRKIYTSPFKDLGKGIVGVYPMLSWSNDFLKKYIEEYGIPVSPTYEKYGTNGCMYCPYRAPYRECRILLENRWLVDVLRRVEERSGETAWPGVSVDDAVRLCSSGEVDKIKEMFKGWRRLSRPAGQQ